MNARLSLDCSAIRIFTDTLHQTLLDQAEATDRIRPRCMKVGCDWPHCHDVLPGNRPAMCAMGHRRNTDG